MVKCDGDFSKFQCRTHCLPEDDLESPSTQHTLHTAPPVEDGVAKEMMNVVDTENWHRVPTSFRPSTAMSADENGHDIFAEFRTIVREALLEQQQQLTKLHEPLIQQQQQLKDTIEELLLTQQANQFNTQQQLSTGGELSPERGMEQFFLDNLCGVKQADTSPDKPSIASVAADLQKSPPPTVPNNDHQVDADGQNHSSPAENSVSFNDAHSEQISLNSKSQEETPKKQNPHTHRNVLERTKEFAVWQKNALACAQGWVKEEIVKLEISGRSFISGRKSKGYFAELNGLLKVVESTTFDNICGIAIVLNAIMIGWQADRMARHPWNKEPGHFQAMESFFCYFFLSELLLRMLALRMRFIFSRDWQWNFFDVVVVLVAVIDEVTYRMGAKDEGSGSNMTILRVLRILRLTRIVRMIRVMRMFYELRIMVHSTLHCARSLVWAMVLLFLVMYTFGVYFTQLAAEEIKRNGDTSEGYEKSSDLREYYGSIYHTLYSMFRAISGGMDWNDFAKPLAEMSSVYVLLFVFYIAFTTFALMNVVTAVFVEQAAKNVLNDKNFAIEEQLSSQKSTISGIRKMFKEADEDHSGTLSWAEFENHLEDTRVQAFFSALDLDTAEAKGLFQLLDLDGNGDVEVDEFVMGCLRLKGQAKALDMATLLHENKKMFAKWQVFMGKCESHFITTRRNELEIRHEVAKLARVVERSNAVAGVDPNVTTALQINHI